MTLVLIFMSGSMLVLLSILCVLVAMRGTRRLDGPSLVGKTVLISTSDTDQTFRGVVLAEHADRVTLQQAFAVTPIGETAVGGLVHLPRAKFDAVQQIEPPVSKPRDPTLVSR